MIINGGTISGSASSKGYSVYVDAGTAITMTGGTITSSTGGGVYLYPGWDDETINTEGMSSFTMTGGTITGNGGIGVYVFDGCTFTLNGGTISDNSGSGVYVYGYGEMAASGTASAKFEMKSGTITGNSATYGGGVYVVAGNGNAVFTMTGGAIYDNTASKAGNDVYSVKDYDAGTVSVKLIAVDLMYADGVDFSSLAWYEDYENTTDDATGLMVNRYSSDNVTNVVSVDYAITSSIALTVADGAFYLGVSGSSTQVPAMISSELGGTTLYFKVSSEYFGDDYYTTNSYPETSLTFTETTVTDDGYSETSTHSYIFAGWYSYDSETGKYSAMTSFPEEADAYAKFVDANVLT
ncbi:MAG: right-handed parallel beta-helix repeat-containing protein, partial [Oscillospiraceae bacterium]|nr:right-handed parallel beta-helix repeat-containing protein [Oscillospiraceae bacterium]